MSNIFGKMPGLGGMGTQAIAPAPGGVGQVGGLGGAIAPTGTNWDAIGDNAQAQQVQAAMQRGQAAMQLGQVNNVRAGMEPSVQTNPNFYGR